MKMEVRLVRFECMGCGRHLSADVEENSQYYVLATYYGPNKGFCSQECKNGYDTGSLSLKYRQFKNKVLIPAGDKILYGVITVAGYVLPDWVWTVPFARGL